MQNETVAKKPHVVIVGAGFGGIRTARALAKNDVKITLIDKYNYHLFQPLLYQVATAGLSVDDIAYPVRAIFRDQKNVDFRLAEVSNVDFETKVVTMNTGQISYDYLVVAAGGMTNYFGMASMEKNGFGMKTLDESVEIRNHVLRMFELAAHERDADKRRALLTFVIVGGGPTGVESAGALSELIYHVMVKEYHNMNFKEVRIMLVEASDKLLATMPEELRDITVETLIRKHVEVRMCVQVTEYDGQRMSLKGGEVIPTYTVIWAAGVKANNLIDTLDVEQASMRRAVVNEYLQLPTRPEVFIIGDAAHCMQGERPLPMVAPVAMQQADATAKNIRNIIRGKELKKFVYKEMGNMATIGRNAAVVHMGKFKTHGFFAWAIWSFVHILRLIDFRNRAVVFVKWMWDYLVYERVVRIITRQ
ncbi:NAD(P)/FAD-dependent oxidoreductase [Pelosinus sp. IPA-1]|uniref:NAD(P)/FAD-dependent oxidoreductase n=1 Tax=Pelosinus sp. IPA-1 TaxID=3029569 RepID=UPI002436215A|nr:NAD(P)/FAD-dependent oxidoreductase [Pelosinus sp. IPA-1]GMB01425.1 pyridine nucleotide-disulfide oxidoreductase [Pelosinus sp. IPA-1]